jgi:predicted DNA binding CopG/RHH family protein
MKIDADEKDLLESVERGEWKSAGGGKRARTRYARYAKATFRKDRRLNIRLSSRRCAGRRNPRGSGARGRRADRYARCGR